MKNYKDIFIVLAILFQSCSKPGSETIHMQVLEYKSQTPIAGVTVSFLKTKLITSGNFPYFEETVFKSGTTDGNGNFSYSRKDLQDADAGIVLYKLKYWKGEGGEGKRYMSSEAYLNLHLQQTTINCCAMTMWVEGEHSKSAELNFPLPQDSIISLRAFGDETSIYSWFITAVPPNCLPSCPQDTVAHGSFQVNIGKGATGAYTLQY